MVERILNISKKLGKKSSAFLFGARGTGKTSLYQRYLQNTESPVLVLDLLTPAIYTSYLTDQSLFRLQVERALKKSGSLLVVIDEVQRLPFLLNVVHQLIEDHKPNLRFLLTGSSARKLKRGGTNLLGGRALNLKLHPLTYAESPSDLDEMLRLGTLPGILIDNENPESSLRSYVATYLREEIQQEALVRRVDSFGRFLELAGQYHGEPVNFSAIGKSCGVSPNTVITYYEILNDTLLTCRLPGWSASVKKQLRTTPKIYLFDNGVANAIRGELNIELRKGTSRYGKLFEAWIIQNAFWLNDYHELDLKFSYWKTNNDQEVDLIVSRGLSDPIAALEIKSSNRPDEADLKTLKLFADDYPTAKLYCVCQAELPYELNGIEILPWKHALVMLQKI